MLYRKIETVIEEHLKSDSKKILLIDGARQVGKTYIIRYVGKNSTKIIKGIGKSRYFNDFIFNVRTEPFAEFSTVPSKSGDWLSGPPNG